MEWDTGAYNANATIPLLTYAGSYEAELIIGPCILFIFLTRVDRLLQFHKRDTWDHILDSLLDCTNRRITHRYLVPF